MSFRYLTAGESHGKALTGIIEGLPSGLTILGEHIQTQLKRRKMGYGRGFRQQIEDDAVEMLGGIRHGKSIGAPIALVIWNKDFTAWKDIMGPEPFAGEGEVRRQIGVPRPGHADLVGGMKYNHTDMRNVLERSSARETTMRVALGSIARRFLEELGIAIASRVIRIGAAADESPLSIPVSEVNAKADASPTRCLDSRAEAAMIAEIDQAKKAGDTLGGIFEVFAEGAPVGLGSYAQWDRRLEARVGEIFLSLNAIKGVEIGLGFGVGKTPGSQAHDEFVAGKGPGPRHVGYKSNRSGGIDGGMSTGQTIVVRAAMKPLATLMNPLQSVDLATGKAESAHVERSDVCAVPSAAVIGETLLALALTEYVLEKFGGDSMDEIIPRVKEWNARTKA